MVITRRVIVIGLAIAVVGPGAAVPGLSLDLGAGCERSISKTESRSIYESVVIEQDRSRCGEVVRTFDLMIDRCGGTPSTEAMINSFDFIDFVHVYKEGEYFPYLWKAEVLAACGMYAEARAALERSRQEGVAVGSPRFSELENALSWCKVVPDASAPSAAACASFAASVLDVDAAELEEGCPDISLEAVERAIAVVDQCVPLLEGPERQAMRKARSSFEDIEKNLIGTYLEGSVLDLSASYDQNEDGVTVEWLVDKKNLRNVEGLRYVIEVSIPEGNQDAILKEVFDGMDRRRWSFDWPNGATEALEVAIRAEAETSVGDLVEGERKTDRVVRSGIGAIEGLEWESSSPVLPGRRRLNWKPLGDGFEYDLELRSGSGGEWKSVGRYSTATAALDLEVAGTWQARVTARRGSRTGPPVTSAPIEVLDTSPLSVDVVRSGAGIVSVSWSAVPGVGSYRVSWRCDELPEAVQEVNFLPVAGEQTDVGSLEVGFGRWVFTVAAMTGSGAVVSSGSSDAIDLPPPAPPSPASNLSSSVPAASSISLEIPEAPGVLDVGIEARAPGSGQWRRLEGSTWVPDADGTWRLRTCVRAPCLEWVCSDTAVVTVVPLEVPRPSGLRWDVSSPAPPGKRRLVWDGAAGIDRYIVEIRTPSGGGTGTAWSSYGTTSSPAMQLELDAPGRWKIRVAAVANGQTSAYSTTSFEVLEAMDIPVTTAVDGKTIRVSWPEVPGAAGYRLNKRAAGGAWSVVERLGPGVTASRLEVDWGRWQVRIEGLSSGGEVFSKGESPTLSVFPKPPSPQKIRGLGETTTGKPVELSIPNSQDGKVIVEVRCPNCSQWTGLSGSLWTPDVAGEWRLHTCLEVSGVPKVCSDESLRVSVVSAAVDICSSEIPSVLKNIEQAFVDYEFQSAADLMAGLDGECRDDIRVRFYAALTALGIAWDENGWETPVDHAGALTSRLRALCLEDPSLTAPPPFSEPDNTIGDLWRKVCAQ